MGITFVTTTVSGAKGKSSRVRMLVDSGAVYSLLPARVWRRLGLKAKRHEEFELADGSTVERDVSECHIRFGGVDGHTPVILGAPGDNDALLGAVTLESLGLVLDPFARRLVRMRLLLAASGRSSGIRPER